MGQLDTRQVKFLGAPATCETRPEEAKEQCEFFEICVLVVNDLGQEVVEADERSHVFAEEVQFVDGCFVLVLERCAVTIIEAVGSALEGAGVLAMCLFDDEGVSEAVHLVCGVDTGRLKLAR